MIKDKLFKLYLDHHLLRDKYGLETLNLSHSEGLSSDIPIVRSIAMLIDFADRNHSSKQVYDQISKYLQIHGI